ncbi:RHS repeat-associated protein [Chryseobacterium ginsenosidimutans]|uniref:RHS repeat domain-containing protein n=1 Tax=Chryseobacterium ginsenosidimutans TaxID=687846 RepID=UPI002787A8A2|nr:RHS repeat-associated core domain-containing protein [Chryseobacterium ginsenosidimutans]MDQ0593694.1 RHS repeat-associated protein [Chryseobacterium ginsenosidimutans]
MTNQTDKGILEIKYNALNLPDYVKFDKTFVPKTNLGGNYNVNVQYIYRADGAKLKKTYTYGATTNNTETATATEYLDGFQYEATSSTGKFTLGLKFVPTAEGYYNFENNKYIYSYTDHLGNIRVSYSKNASGSAEVLEENNFYPFGMKHEGYNQTAENPSYNYGYNGKEYQTETGWSDYGARMYMSDIGRWGVIDPLAETSRRFTPYNYAYNNPVMFIDPDGRKAMAPKAPAENLTVPGGMLDYYGRGGTGKLTNLLAFLGQENYFHIADDTMLGGGGGGNGTFGQTQVYKDIMAYLAEPETEYFQGINFTQFGGDDDCPKCPKSNTVRLGEEIGKQVLKPQEGFWERLSGTRTWTDSKGNDYLVDSEGKIIMRAPLTGDVPIGPAGNLKGLKSLFTFTKSAGKHFTEIIKSGENASRLARPYMRSSLTIQEIIATGKGIPDATAKGALNFRVPGTFRITRYMGISCRYKNKYYLSFFIQITIMKFIIEYNGKPEQRLLIYRNDEYSFDMDPWDYEMDFDIIINKLTLTVVNNKIIQLSGFCGLNNAMKNNYDIPKSKKGILKIVDNLNYGFAYNLGDNFPVYINIQTGWICIGVPDKHGNAVEFINNCIAVIDTNEELIALWLKPEELPVLHEF